MRRRSFLLAAGGSAFAAADLQNQNWKARWIWPANLPPAAYAVCQFRCRFELNAAPRRFLVHVTADSRYRLFVNGRSISTGPARGDLLHWRFETVDLAPFLNPGANVLAAVVGNDGPHAALCQWSAQTGFLLQADEEAGEALVNTGQAPWKTLVVPAYQPEPVPPAVRSTGYFAIGPMERFNAAAYPWGWETLEYADSAWTRPEAGRNGSPRDMVDGPSRWMLVPRPIPQMEETPERLAQVRDAGGLELPAEFPGRPTAFIVPAGRMVKLLLDQGHLTCGYPELRVRGGAGAQVTLRYAEALFATVQGRRTKGNRGEIAGKAFIGYGDVYLADGGARTWRPLYWRTWRYLELEIETKAEALTIEDLQGIYTGFPFARLATLDTGDPLHQRMLDVGWRTARLCAHETYMDCPYYEQLQYAGDTRIQCLVSLYMSGDARLMRNAIEQLDSSRTPEGATYSRAPSVLQQYIPPFSLWWIAMVHDYWRYVPDPGFVHSMLAGVRAVLGFYARFRNDEGLLGPMPWWNYVDWVDAWPRGVPPSDGKRMGASIHFQWLLALQHAAGLERALGSARRAEECSADAASSAGAVRKTFWDLSRRLFTEDPAHQHPSQHANSLAVLAGVAAGEEAKDLMRRVEGDASLHPCSIYFRYYLNRAMVQAGLGDLYLERVGVWKTMLNDGLTTWAEKDGSYSRSDCHAWGSSPNLEFFRTVLGVDSAAPGFAQVVIRPHLGPLKRIRGTVPHPKGTISVELDARGEKPVYKISLPPGVTGRLEWGSIRTAI